MCAAYAVKVLDKQTMMKQRGACGGHHNDADRKDSDEIELVVGAVFVVGYELVEFHADHSVDEEEADVDEQAMG